MEILQIEDVSFDNQKMNVCFSVDSKDIPLYEYAYYVYYNEAIIERHGYSPIKTKNTCFSFEPIESGSYSFRIFIRLNGKLIAHQISPPIHLDLRMNEQVETNFNAEKVYMNDVPLKYILEDHSTISDRLLVVFAGIHTREFQGGRGVFNYYRTLKHLKVNKLFLLDDYQGQFCYYMGANRSHDFERTVVALLTETANKLQISADKIITIGSSKGGSAALYYALKYHLGTAVVAAPQILIGDYLIEKSKKNDAIKSAMDRMFGDNRSKGQRYYNNKILNLVKMKTSYPDIFFHIGKGDFHYEQHFQPFWKECLRNDITIELNVQDYSDHSLTGTYFQPYLLKKT